MAVKNISRERFAQLLPADFSVESSGGNQLEWWANEGETILGTVAKQKSTEGWLYVLLGRDGHGEFGVLSLELGMNSLHAARLRLLQAIESCDCYGSRRGWHCDLYH